MDQNTNDSQNFLALWEQFRERFGRNREDERFGEESPRRRSAAIAFCICLSIFLWFIFSMQETYTTELVFPTQLVNIPDDQALADLPPRTVRAQVQGQGFTLLQLRYDPPIIPINASDDRINLFDAAPNLPSGADLESIYPTTLDLRKEPRVTREVPVRLMADIKTPAAYALLEPPTIEPDTVLATGARSIVEGLQFWPTTRVEVSGLRDSLVRQVPLADTLDGLVRLSNQSITMRAVARQFTEGTRMIDVMVTGVPSTDEMQIVTLEREQVRVRYRVLLSQYERAQNTGSFYATVSYESIRSDTTGSVRPVAHVPNDLVIRNVELIPSSLQYYNVLPSR